MCRWIRICEAADLAFLIVDQPAHTILRCMAINKWAVLVRHNTTIVNSLGPGAAASGKAGWLTIDPSGTFTAMKVFAAVMMALAAGCAANAEPSPESIRDSEARQQALKLLCPIAHKAGGGWGDDNINRGIASIQYGEEWPPNRAQFSAYKLCLIRGYSK